MLEKVNPEVVSIAVPTRVHYEAGMAALEAGAHILIEKPISFTLAEGEKMIARAQERHRQLMVGHIVRFNPAVQALRQKLQGGELGRIFQIFCRRTGPFPTRISDVGCVIDLAPHDLDLMRFLTGKDPVRVYAETQQRLHNDHEDLMFGLLHFAEGITGAIEINWLTPTKVREILVLGERGLFRVDDLLQDLYFYENTEAGNIFWSGLSTLKGVSEGNLTRYAIRRYEPLRLELQEFLRSVREQTPVPVSGEDGLTALRLALALAESGQTQRVIEV
jgi:UDP-N-acetylglucosamine 3-dehydrogenase